MNNTDEPLSNAEIIKNIERPTGSTRELINLTKEYIKKFRSYLLLAEKVSEQKECLELSVVKMYEMVVEIFKDLFESVLKDNGISVGKKDRIVQQVAPFYEKLIEKKEFIKSWLEATNLRDSTVHNLDLNKLRDTINQLERYLPLFEKTVEFTDK